MRPREILYFSRMRFPESRARSIQVASTAREMARAGAKVRLFVRKTAETDLAEGRRRFGLVGVDGLEIVPIHWPHDARLGLVLRLLRARRRGPVVFLRQVDPYAVTLVRAARRLGLKAVFEAHGVKHLIEAESAGDDDARVRPWFRMEREIVEGASGVIATTSHAERMLRSLFRITAPTIVVPNGAPSPDPGDPAASRDIDLLYSGQLYRWKGIDLLFDVLARLPDTILHVVGGNRPEDLVTARRAAASRGVDARVVFHGQVAPDAVPCYLRRARCAIVPLPETGSIEARWFTSPLKLFEFQAAGVPVVASDLPSVREALGDSDSALLAPAGDAAALASAVRRILVDPQLASRLSAAGLLLASERGWDRRARTILRFLDTIAPLE